jgi:hypothetical protein
VESTDERSDFCQCSSWGEVGEGLADSGVELQCDQIEIMLAVHRERSVFLGRYCLSSALVFLVGAALPGAFRVAEEVGLHLGLATLRTSCDRQSSYPAPGGGVHHGLGQFLDLAAQCPHNAFAP